MAHTLHHPPLESTEGEEGAQVHPDLPPVTPGLGAFRPRPHWVSRILIFPYGQYANMCTWDWSGSCNKRAQGCSSSRSAHGQVGISAPAVSLAASWDRRWRRGCYAYTYGHGPGRGPSVRTPHAVRRGSWHCCLYVAPGPVPVCLDLLCTCVCRERPPNLARALRDRPAAGS